MALKPLTLAAALGLTLTLAAPAAQATTYFSIDAASPSVGLFGILPGSILTPGPVGGPPTVFLGAPMLGLLPGDDLDALAFSPGFYGGDPHFSVDAASVGIPIPPFPNVASEGVAGQAAGDIFSAFFALPGTNSLVTNQDVLGLVPVAPPGAFVPPMPIDNLDALEYAPTGFAPGPGMLLFSLAAGSPTLGLIGAGAEDILVWTASFAPPTVFMPGAALGLLPGDDLDALTFVGGPYFSLAPGSPTLGMIGASAADILAPGPVVFLPAVAMGLAPGDNMDALAAAPIPEPETYAMMLAGLGLLGGMTRLRRRG